MDEADDLGAALRQALETGRPVKLSAIGTQRLQQRHDQVLCPIADEIRRRRLEAEWLGRTVVVD